MTWKKLTDESTDGQTSENEDTLNMENLKDLADFMEYKFESD